MKFWPAAAGGLYSLGMLRERLTWERPAPRVALFLLFGVPVAALLVYVFAGDRGWWPLVPSIGMLLSFPIEEYLRRRERHQRQREP